MESGSNGKELFQTIGTLEDWLAFISKYKDVQQKRKANTLDPPPRWLLMVVAIITVVYMLWDGTFTALDYFKSVCP